MQLEKDDQNNTAPRKGLSSSRQYLYSILNVKDVAAYELSGARMLILFYEQMACPFLDRNNEAKQHCSP